MRTDPRVVHLGATFSLGMILGACSLTPEEEPRFWNPQMRVEPDWVLIRRDRSPGILNAEYPLITRATDWESLWEGHDPSRSRKLPAVDFKAHMVLAVFLGRDLKVAFGGLLIDRGDGALSISFRIYPNFRPEFDAGSAACQFFLLPRRIVKISLYQRLGEGEFDGPKEVRLLKEFEVTAPDGK